MGFSLGGLVRTIGRGVGGFVSSGGNPLAGISAAIGGGNGGRGRPTPGFVPTRVTRGGMPVQIPSGGRELQGGPCPPGTRCRGLLSTRGFCIGSCEPYTPTFAPGPTVPGPGPFGPNLPDLPPQGPVPVQAGGCACNGGRALCACCTTSGQRGRFNKTGYYVYGRCGDPAQATYIPPGTRCVSSRRINPANGRAARRAVVRLNSTLGLLRSVEKSMQKLVRSRRRRG